MTRRQVSALQAKQAKAQIEEYGEVKHELGKILPVYSVKSFCNCLISLVRVVMTNREDDINDLDTAQNISGVVSKDQHTWLTVKEVARLFNTGIDMAKAMLEVMTQYGIWMAIHPMMQ